MYHNTNEDVLDALRMKLRNQDFRGDTVEIQGAHFIVTDNEIVPDTLNQEYMQAEIDWYEKGTPYVQDLFEIYGKPVKIWQDVADVNGRVNSNYGWCIYSSERHRQYATVVDILKEQPLSRQAVMYYTTPLMHEIAGKDHTCTYSVQYFMNYENDTFGRGYLDAHVYMRSNDAVYGFNNDLAWQRHVLQKLANDVGALAGDIYWNAGSMHVYSRHYDKLLGDQGDLL